MQRAIFVRPADWLKTFDEFASIPLMRSMDATGMHGRDCIITIGLVDDGK
jgi:hypothetical protein